MGHRSDFSAFDRLMIVVVAFVFFAAVGFLLVLLLGKLGVLPNDDFMTEALPVMLAFGVVAGGLAWRYPAAFEWVTGFIP